MGMLIGYGGQVRTVPPDATAVAQRDVIMKAVYHAAAVTEAFHRGLLLPRTSEGH